MPVATMHAAPEPLADPVATAAFWPLDAAYEFLNHGSFGSVPWTIQEAQRRHRDAIEARPIELLGRRCRELLAVPRERVARLLGADPEGLGFLTNATEGVNSVLRSIEFRAGDVLITTTHVYHAVRQAMRFAARRAGAELREVDVPVPITSAEDVVDRVVSALDARTRLVLIDHVTSPTALIYPAAEIVRVCRERGIESFVDGAHAPGMLDVDIAALGATYYTGNLHKWVCAPKGCGFLWVEAARRRQVHPAIVSHYLDDGFGPEFDWQGTRDISAWLAATDAIELWETVGWERVRRHNHALALWAQRHLCERFEVAPLAPDDGGSSSRFIGSMSTVPLPAGIESRFDAWEALQLALYEKHRIEAPIVPWGGRWFCRVSSHVYNRAEQYRRLADALLALAGRGPR